MHFEPLATAKGVATCHVTLFGWQIRGSTRVVALKWNMQKCLVFRLLHPLPAVGGGYDFGKQNTTI